MSETRVAAENAQTFIVTDRDDVALSLVVGGAAVSLRNRSGKSLAFDSAYRDFLLPVPGRLSLDLYYRQPPPSSPGTSLRTHVPDHWRILERSDAWVFEILAGNSSAYQTAVINKDLRHGDYYYYHAGSGQGEENHDCLPPLEYPMDFLLFSRLLLRERALILHGCAVMYEGKCFIFSGRKGAGKSTSGKLWRQQGAQTLNDEQLVLRLHDGRLWVYGSPWYGESRHCSNLRAPVDALFFISHGLKNHATPISVAPAARTLVSKCFISTTFKEEVASLISAAKEMAVSAPMFEYAFVPDQSAVDYVLEMNR